MERKALIYCRVSSERQKNDGHGLDSQEHRCREYAARLGYKVERVFPDSFTGGGDYMKRPKMAEMLEYIADNGHKEYVVIFDDLKRLARDTISHWQLRDHFKKLGAIVDSPNFEFKDDESTWLHEAISAVFNENERRTNRVQVIQKMKARMEKGYWTFGSVIPGYKRQQHALGGWLLVKDEIKSVLVFEALEGFANGRFLSRTEVKNFLTRHDFKDGKAIHLSLVDRLIERRVLYAGYIEYPKWDIDRRKGHHEAIINDEILEKLDAIVAGKPILKKRKNDNPDFPLRGLFVVKHAVLQ
ncbi:MAG: recombinase family protein [Patescibacteria group bacterium]